MFLNLAYVKPVTEFLIATSLGMANAVSSVSVTKNIYKDIEYSQSSVIISSILLCLILDST